MAFQIPKLYARPKLGEIYKSRLLQALLMSIIVFNRPHLLTFYLFEDIFDIC